MQAAAVAFQYALCRQPQTDTACQRLFVFIVDGAVAVVLLLLLLLNKQHGGHPAFKNLPGARQNMGYNRPGGMQGGRMMTGQGHQRGQYGAGMQMVPGAYGSGNTCNS
jgi:hypothetical protein